MTDLSPDDLAILAREDCLVDGDVAAKAVWLAGTHRAASDWDRMTARMRGAAQLEADAALGAQGLIPGQPALHLILAATQRRGWGYLMGDGADGSHGNHWARVYAPRRPFQAGPGCASPVVALALAFVAAVRAMEEAMPRLRDVLSSMQDTD